MWRQMLARSFSKKLPPVFVNSSRNHQQQQQQQQRRKQALIGGTLLLSAAHVLVDQFGQPTLITDDDSSPTVPSANPPATGASNAMVGDLPDTAIDELQIAADMETTFAESGEALNNLIRTLHACVQEICDQYQHCIARQIEITVACMEMEPVGPHWDELTKYRVMADDLRVELLKYKALIATIGSIVTNEPFNGSAETGGATSDGEGVVEGIGGGGGRNDSPVRQSYQNLLELVERKTKENHTWDAKLLDMHKKSIVDTGDLTFMQ